MSRYRAGAPRPSQPPAALGDLLRDAHRTVAARSDLAVDSDRWEEAVGPRIARAAKPGRLQAGVLTVHVASSSWAQELSLLADQIVARLVARGVGLRRLAFQVTPAARSAPRGAPASTPRRASPASEPPALPDDLRQRLDSFQDAELAGDIADAARHSLALAERRQSRAKDATSRGDRGSRSGARGSAPSDRTDSAPNARPRRTR